MPPQRTQWVGSKLAPRRRAVWENFGQILELQAQSDARCTDGAHVSTDPWWTSWRPPPGRAGPNGHNTRPEHPGGPHAPALTCCPGG